MAVSYRTIEGDILDEICWNYYINDSSMAHIAMDIDPNLSDTQVLKQALSQSQSQGFGGDLNVIVDSVLKINPFLAEYPTQLPAGLTIKLPQVGKNVSSDNISLWE